jgi:hypothetical protein
MLDMMDQDICSVGDQFFISYRHVFPLTDIGSSSLDQSILHFGNLASRRRYCGLLIHKCTIQEEILYHHSGCDNGVCMKAETNSGQSDRNLTLDLFLHRQSTSVY